MKKFLADCKEVSRLISRSQDETLPAPERARLRLHLALCSTCRGVEEQIGFLRRVMRSVDQDEPPVK